MSRAYAQRTVKFINKVGTFTAYLQSANGDLWQTYTRDGSTYTGITPDFSVTKPVVDFVVISSRVAGISNLNGYPTWYLGDNQINDGATVRSAYSSYFDILSNTGSGRQYYGLRIKNNLVALTSGSSITLKATGSLLISGTGTTDTITAQTVIAIEPSTGSGVKAIVRDTTYQVQHITRPAFTFTAEEEQMNMTVDVYEGGNEVTSGLTYKWQMVTNGTWADLTDGGSGGNIISGSSTKNLTIGENVVMTYTQVRCNVMKSNAHYVYGLANIMDATDPYVIEPHPNPTDETIENDGQGSPKTYSPTTRSAVTYTPKIISRNSGSDQTAMTAQGFYFTYTSSDGTEQTPVSLKNKACTGTASTDTFITGGASSNYPVTYAMCVSNGDISVIIESAADLVDY